MLCLFNFSQGVISTPVKGRAQFQSRCGLNSGQSVLNCVKMGGREGGRVLQFVLNLLLILLLLLLILLLLLLGNVFCLFLFVTQRYFSLLSLFGIKLHPMKPSSTT
uniref:Uncharacterized protein n=1 Tax=Cacopsylla melanoneura TaxID=428564 RepID=A0A8D9A8G5_9HEMI